MSVSTWDAFGAYPSERTRQRQRRRSAAAAIAAQAYIAAAPAAIRPHVAARHSGIRREMAGIVLAGITVVALHATLALFWDNHSHSQVRQIPKHEVMVELVKPKQPEAEKIEPPKPLPQKIQPVAKSLPKTAPIQSSPVTPAVSRPEPVAAETPAAAIAPTLAPTPTAAQEPAQEVVTQATGYAGYLHNPPPAYPANAQRMGLEGKVLLRVRVLASGKPASVEIQNSSGRKMLDEAAINAVQGWVFAPARRGQTPIDGWATVPVEFKLERS